MRKGGGNDVKRHIELKKPVNFEKASASSQKMTGFLSSENSSVIDEIIMKVELLFSGSFVNTKYQHYYRSCWETIQGHVSWFKNCEEKLLQSNHIFCGLWLKNQLHNQTIIQIWRGFGRATDGSAIKTQVSVYTYQTLCNKWSCYNIFKLKMHVLVSNIVFESDPLSIPDMSIKVYGTLTVDFRHAKQTWSV